METKLRFDDIADLSRLQSKRGFIKFSHHLSVTEPAEIAAFVLAAWIGRKLLR